MEGDCALSEVAIYREAWRAAHRLPRFIADLDGRLIWGSAAFLRSVAVGDMIGLDKQRLTFPDPAMSASFLAFVNGLGPDPAVWLARAPETDAHVLFRCVLVEPANCPSGIACTVYDNRDPDLVVWADFASQFRLTPSEARISRRLMAGVTLVRAATHLGITTGTAKSHLRRIYAKLAVSSREEFYGRLLPFRLV
mgnify:CR=1 FL=1